MYKYTFILVSWNKSSPEFDLWTVCILTSCSVAWLGSRWALTLAPHCVQLIWTRTACQTCWWGHPCTASYGMRAKCLCTSARAMWVGTVGQREHDTKTHFTTFTPFHLHRCTYFCCIYCWLCLLSCFFCLCDEGDCLINHSDKWLSAAVAKLLNLYQMKGCGAFTAAVYCRTFLFSSACSLYLLLSVFRVWWKKTECWLVTMLSTHTLENALQQSAT